MNLEGATMEDLLVRDTKRYELFGKKVIISQVMVPSFVYPQAHADEIQQELARLRVQQGVDIYMGLFTSVMENGSELFASADSNLLSKIGLKSQPVSLVNMMSRKKDLIPWFGEKLRSV
jgi:manganese-dependent inorganic pyrophosphatase